MPTLLAEAESEAAHGGFARALALVHLTPEEFWLYLTPIIAALIIVMLIVFGVRRLLVVPAGRQNFIELLVETLYGIPEMVMGPRGRQYAPFICTFFLYILLMNLLGLVPPFKAGTASLSITVGLAVAAFLATQYYGFKAHGIRYLLHFLGPVWWMAPFLVFLELLSEFIRPVSLSFRLYGNIYGEEQVVSALATNLGVPGPFFAVLLLPLEVLTSVLQALVFTLLVSVYISLATEKHGEHEEASEGAH
jgi:F-type H+-transporting ATPase subunit a